MVSCSSGNAIFPLLPEPTTTVLLICFA